ncbi:MAG: carboxypeptidase regulatory-like domain-containing protein [Myxococcaceae bacterium]|nr:carboxypeptidase regulatory-like domain-containing protein [Myxococcaceae bacterium]
MRQTPHIVMTALLSLGVGGCFELENAPFRVGTVHGQLRQSDPAVALVSVLDHPELLSAVAPDGTFTLEQVPSGEAELFIIASASKALRPALTVPGGQSVSLGLVEPAEASFLELRLKAPGYQDVDEAWIDVVGTPLQGLRPDESGRLLVGPLPDGCYTLAVSLEGFPEVRSETCVSIGETKDVKVNLPAPNSGCTETGCSDGFHCAPDDRCVECLEDAHCGSNLVCQNSRCEGQAPFCTPCAGDWNCRSDASCQELPQGGSACVERCDDGDACEDGFTCQAGQCLPDTARFNGCGAYLSLGADCEGDERCRALGLVNGLCVEAKCTLPCTEDRECSDTFRCSDTAFGRVCQPD